MTSAAAREVVMLGAGGHAKVLHRTLVEQGVVLAGYIAPTDMGAALVGIPWLGSDEAFAELDPSLVLLVNGVGSVSSMAARRRSFRSGHERGFGFLDVVDVSATVQGVVARGEGVQILAGAIIGWDVRLGSDVIVNSGAIVDHDSSIMDHSHIATGAALAGNVQVGTASHVGLGARVIQGTVIGSESTVGAGAVVLSDVPDRSLAIGVPARSRSLAPTVGSERPV